MAEVELISFEHSEKVKLISRPKVVLNLKGASYLNKKAAGLLNIQHGDGLRFYFTKDGKVFLSKDDLGATVTLNAGLYRFCERSLIRKIFDLYQIKGTKAEFPTATSLDTAEEIKVLLMIPNPFNIS